MRIRVASDAEAARSREIERDGEAPETLAFIAEWAASERAFFAAQPPWERADLVVGGYGLRAERRFMAACPSFHIVGPVCESSGLRAPGLW